MRKGKLIRTLWWGKFDVWVKLLQRCHPVPSLIQHVKFLEIIWMESRKRMSSNNAGEYRLERLLRQHDTILNHTFPPLLSQITAMHLILQSSVGRERIRVSRNAPLRPWTAAKSSSTRAPKSGSFTSEPLVSLLLLAMLVLLFFPIELEPDRTKRG